MRSTGRIPHALLLKGTNGVGKSLFAERLAAQLLCLEHSRAPCGVCRGCTLVISGSHPDFNWIRPENNSATITVLQIREFIGSLSLTAALSARKVGVIQPAERMTTAAANSLLKTLEEPPGETVLILVTNASGWLPATIVSRCQAVDFPPVPQSEGRLWLESKIDPGQDGEFLMKLSRGQPLTALTWIHHDELPVRIEFVEGLTMLLGNEPRPVETASRWKALGIGRCANWLSSVLMDMIKLTSTQDNTHLTNTDLTQSMQPWVSQLDSRTLFALLDTCQNAVRLTATHPGLNEQLILEDFTIALANAVRRSA